MEKKNECRFKYFVDSLGLSITKFAAITGLSRTYVYYMYIGKFCNPSISILRSMADGLGVKIETIVELF